MDDGTDRRRGEQAPGEEAPRCGPPPVARVERAIEAEGLLLPLGAGEFAGEVGRPRQVHDRQIEKIDARRVRFEKRQGRLRLGLALLRRAEQDIDVGGDAGGVEGVQDAGGRRQLRPLVQTLEDLLGAALQAELEHTAAASRQTCGQRRLGEGGIEADEAVPGQPREFRRRPGQGAQRRRRQGVVGEVETPGTGRRRQLAQQLRRARSAG